MKNPSQLKPSERKALKKFLKEQKHSIQEALQKLLTNLSNGAKEKF